MFIKLLYFSNQLFSINSEKNVLTKYITMQFFTNYKKKNQINKILKEKNLVAFHVLHQSMFLQFLILEFMKFSNEFL